VEVACERALAIFGTASCDIADNRLLFRGWWVYGEQEVLFSKQALQVEAGNDDQVCKEVWEKCKLKREKVVKIGGFGRRLWG
jgi:stalled ribosome rescue protein Dom34